MARSLRLEAPGNIYHVTVRGDRREDIFDDDADRVSMLDLINDAVELHHWHLLAYCLMNNHYHLEVETPIVNLAAGMHRINGAYSQRYNARHHRVGHVFQGRYKALPILTDPHLLGACRYIVRNPLRAGLVSDPGQWEWSSYRASALLAPPLSGCDAAWIRNAVAGGSPERYRAWVMTGLDDACDYLHPLRKTPGPRVEEHIDAVQAPPAWESMPTQASARRPLDDILSGCSWKMRDDTRLPLVRLRVREAVDAGYSQRAIAAALGTTHVTVGKILRS